MRIALSVNLGSCGLFLLTCLEILLSCCLRSIGGGLVVLTFFLCGGNRDSLFDCYLNFFNPFFDDVGLFEFGDLVDVVLYFKLELNLASALDILLLCFADTNLVLSDIIGESLKNLSFGGVLDEERHVTEFVVKSDSLLEWEHTAPVEDLLSVLGTVISKTVLNADRQGIVLLNNKACN